MQNPPRTPLDIFSDVRSQFHEFCFDMLDLALAPLSESYAPRHPRGHGSALEEDIPPELLAQYNMSDEDFAQFLVSKLGKWVGMLDTKAGRDIVFDKMLVGVADEDPSYFDFLSVLSDHAEDRDLFLEYLRVLTAAALKIVN